MNLIDRLAARDAAVAALRAGYNTVEHDGSRTEINAALKRLLHPEPAWWQRVVTRLRQATQATARTRHHDCEGVGEESTLSSGRLGTPQRAVAHLSTGGAQ